jgi:hypothetical protein
MWPMPLSIKYFSDTREFTGLRDVLWLSSDTCQFNNVDLCPSQVELLAESISVFASPASLSTLQEFWWRELLFAWRCAAGKTTAAPLLAMCLARQHNKSQGISYSSTYSSWLPPPHQRTTRMASVVRGTRMSICLVSGEANCAAVIAGQFGW